MDLKYNFGWGSNDNGNLLSVTNDMDSNRSVTYGYDHLNRIASATTANTDCTVLSTGITKNWGESFTIDPWGNLTNRTVTKCSADPLSVIALPNNQLSGFGYDADGNMTSNGSTTYVYDGESRLQSVNGVTYTYDGEGNRVIKSSGTEYWGAGPMLESSSTGHLMFEYIFAGGKRIARRDVSTGLVSYYLTDNLGSTNKFVKSTGVIQNDSDYYPYGGERIYAQGATGQNYRFSGKEYDSESGLDNFGARYDSSSLGRFMTPDWGVAPVTVPYAVFGDPQSLNLYAYVENGPVNRVDADGHGCAGPVGGASTTDVGTTGPSCEQLQHTPANTNAADASQSTLTEAQAQSQINVKQTLKGGGELAVGFVAVVGGAGMSEVGIGVPVALGGAALMAKGGADLGGGLSGTDVKEAKAAVDVVTGANGVMDGRKVIATAITGDVQKANKVINDYDSVKGGIKAVRELPKNPSGALNKIEGALKTVGGYAGSGIDFYRNVTTPPPAPPVPGPPTF